jgi:hypothetical protein
LHSDKNKDIHFYSRKCYNPKIYHFYCGNGTLCKDKKDVLNEIAEKLDTTIRIVEKLGYEPEKVSAKEFHDWMNREIFSEDTTTLNDVLSNEYYMVHELVEISELKKAGFKIHKRSL